MKDYRLLSDLHNDLLSGKITCEALTKYFISKAKKHTDLNIFLELFESSAIKKAEEVDEKIRKGTQGKLAGLIVSIKDNICYQGHKVSASSKILEGFESLYSATVTERLLEEDAIIIGRTNCDEFAMGSSNENSFYKPVKNPINFSKVPGGSSGGSAASVTAGLAMASLGSDTGGSIRQPASFCGNIGLKPTYGRVSRHGLLAYASSFDQIGPFTNDIETAAAILEVIAGKDEFDSTLSERVVEKYSDLLNNEVSPKKIAYLSCYIEHDGLDSEVKQKLIDTLEALKAKGHVVEKIDFDYLDQLVPAYYVLTTAEASSNLARYDGVHFGYRSPNATDLESTYLKSRSEGFGPEVKRRIMLGTFVLSSGYYDAYYTKAQKVRRLIQEKTKAIFDDFDFIISPTTPHPAFDLGSQNQDPIKMYLEDIFTVQSNLAGIPSISLPLGQHSNGLPFGIQLMAPSFKEGELLQFSKYMINNF